MEFSASLLDLTAVRIRASHFASPEWALVTISVKSPPMWPAKELGGSTEIKWVNAVYELRSTIQTSTTVIKWLRMGRTLTQKALGRRASRQREWKVRWFSREARQKETGLWSLERWKKSRKAYLFKIIKETKPGTPSLKDQTKLYGLTSSYTREWGTVIPQNTLMMACTHAVFAPWMAPLKQAGAACISLIFVSRRLTLSGQEHRAPFSRNEWVSKGLGPLYPKG